MHSFVTYLKEADRYKWHRADNQLSAADLRRLVHYASALRMHLLRSIDKVNRLEKQLLEFSYVNWMRDQIDWCWNAGRSILDAEESTEQHQRNQKSEYERLRLACSELEADLAKFIGK
jgi:hypothetical protein